MHSHIVNMHVTCTLVSCDIHVTCLLLHAVDVWSLAFSADSRTLATGSHNGRINIFSVEEGKKQTALDTRGKFIMSVAYVSLFTGGKVCLPWTMSCLCMFASWYSETCL